jgi:aspartyl-tRNA(Asn)/glutamyl-tRNA(Gln) amidotransferase subunit A
MFSVSKRPTIKEIHDLYKSKKALPSQVFQFFLNRSTQIDKKINSVQTFTEEFGHQKSLELDKIIEQYFDEENHDWFDKISKIYPLFGIPYSLKAIIQAEGLEFRASSKILNGFISPYSSTVFEKVDSAGAVLVSITHMDEFAMGGSGENNAYGVTKNPFDLSRVPGGSSSGPAANTGSGQVVFALGTDTGGSIRQPASFCDVVGLKPTYGLVSRYGVMPMASSFDQVGAFTNSVIDNIIVTKVIAGIDHKDQTTIDSTVVKTALEKHITKLNTQRVNKKLTRTNKPLKIGLPKEFYTEGLDPIIKKALVDLQKKLTKLGHTFIEVSIPLVDYAISTYYMTMSVEVSSNLERYDGIRYRGSHDTVDEKMYFDYRFNNFGDEAKRRIALGTYASSAGYYDAYYNKASKIKEQARQQFEEVFKSVDIILTPTTPEFPFLIGSKSQNPLAMYLSDIYTAVVNPIKIPGLVVPLGFFDTTKSQQNSTDNSNDNHIENETELLSESNENQNLDLAVESVSESNVDKKSKDLKNSQISPKESIKLPTGCQLLGPELSEGLLFELALEIEQLVDSK